MPRIQCCHLTVNPDAAEYVDRIVAENGGRYGDDLDGVIISSVDEAVDLLRWQTPDTTWFSGRFRVDDFPSLTVVWQQVSAASAIAYQLRCGEVEIVHLLVAPGENVAMLDAIAVARRLLGGFFPRASLPKSASAGQVLHIRFTIRQTTSEAEPADLLGFLLIVPVFCELCGVD